MKLPAVAEYTAPCLQSGPLAAGAQQLVTEANGLGAAQWASEARVRIVPLVFDGMEHAFACPGDPLPRLLAVLASAVGHLRHAALTRPEPARTAIPSGRDVGDVADITGTHYGHLFREFSPSSFFDEPASLLRARLARNAVPDTAWTGKRVLDAGCGGGRYTVAWRLIGAQSVTGIDRSTSGINDARERILAAHVSGVQFDHGDVLALPYADDRFDVVFSNGVLHHTVNWRDGIAEAVRVLRRSGLGWLYVIERPGGYFWDLIEVLRVILRNDYRDGARQVLHRDAVPANRIFYMLDHVMVPINVRLTPDEVEAALRSSGATAIRRLTRGTDFDRVEAIHRGDPFASDKYGVGENRFVFSK